MDFLSIRKKARERAEAKEAAASAAKAAGKPGATPDAGPADEAARAAPVPWSPDPPGGVEEPLPPPPPPATAEPPSAGAPSPPFRERRRSRGDEPVLTEEDLVEGALQARFQGFSPTPDGRFATWRPDSGPSPIEPDGRGFVEPAPPRRRPPEPPPAEAPPAAPPEPFDPLDTFFYRPDEEEALVPALGTAAEEPAARPPERLDEFLTFRIGQEEFAVPIERVREVLKAPNITEVPRAPAHVLGVVTVRGEVVAVVDARGRLGLESASGSGGGGRIVIVDAGEGALGLLVDAVASVVRLPRGAIEPCPQGISAAASDCVTGIGRWRDRLFMVVDVATLLGRRPAGER